MNRLIAAYNEAWNSWKDLRAQDTVNVVFGKRTKSRLPLEVFNITEDEVREFYQFCVDERVFLTIDEGWVEAQGLVKGYTRDE